MSSEIDIESYNYDQAYKLLRSDPDTAVNLLIDSSNNGSKNSMMLLGWAYMTGVGVGRDLKKAETWCRMATDNGSVRGSFFLGKIYIENREYEKAFYAFKIGISNEFLPSICQLGTLYYNGIGVDRNKKKALECWKQAADKGHVFAKSYIGHLMLRGELGISKIPQGAKILISVVVDIILIARKDTQSDLLLR